jgi:hypothetical protein
VSDDSLDIIEVPDGDITWRFDRRFLTSNWTCIWGRGCLGILDQPAEHLQQGCCSVGAELADADEAMTISALAATLSPEIFEHHAAVDAHDVFSDATRTNTKVVDGACIFFNRPGFAGGQGCALHIAALAVGESPIGWKPSVCWQLPLRVDWVHHDDGSETATVRGWTRADWGDEGETMHWCCTEGDRAYVGERPVFESLVEELRALVGERVAGEVSVRLRPRRSPPFEDLGHTERA